MERKEFIAEVRKELKHIKANATKEEIDKLDIIDLDPSSAAHCIYGQMTGQCDSTRACELSSKISSELRNIKISDTGSKYYTFLEVYIYEYTYVHEFETEEVEANNASTRHLNHILRYLKGDITRVTLK